MNLDKEDRDLIRLALIAMQAKDERTLDAIASLGTKIQGAEALCASLRKRIKAARALHVRFLQEAS